MSDARFSDVFHRIRNDLQSAPVVIYIKGTRAFPQDGFSAAMVQILDTMQIPYKDVDVLPDPGLHQALKEFASWPGTPQLYVNGQFIGGCDIVREMYDSGELVALFKEQGLL